MKTLSRIASLAAVCGGLVLSSVQGGYSTYTTTTPYHQQNNWDNISIPATCAIYGQVACEYGSGNGAYQHVLGPVGGVFSMSVHGVNGNGYDYRNAYGQQSGDYDVMHVVTNGWADTVFTW